MDLAAVKAEYCHYLPIALEIYKQGSATNFTAWRDALQRRRRGDNSFGNSLRELVKRLGAWCGSTSGVERVFSAQERLCDPQRTDVNRDLVEDEAHLLELNKITHADVEDVVKRARKHWGIVYGDQRRSARQRTDVGATRTGTDSKAEQQWIKRRRLAVDTVVKNERNTDAEDGPNADFWTERHTKELHFQRAKQQSYKITAFKDNLLLQSQIGGDRAGLENDLLVKQFKLAKNAAELEKRHKTRNLKINKQSPLLKENMTVFLEPGVEVDDTAIRQMKLNVTGERKAANVIVTSNLHQLGQRTRWCLALSGA